ncbi:MAG: hypothetical protein RIS79_262 [Verrucomicrobiota bacterium]
MVLGDNRHLLHRFQAFVAGLKWANGFKETNQEKLYSFLTSIEIRLSQSLIGSDSGVGWFDELLKRTDSDEQKAFELLLDQLATLAGEDKIVDKPTE